MFVTKDDAQANENPSVTEEHHPVARWTSGFFYLVGCITLVLAMIGMVYNEFTGLHGTVTGGWLTLMVPLFIGIPAILLSMIQTLACRLNRFRISVMLLLIHILVVLCTLLILAVIGWVFGSVIGNFLAAILGIPLLIGIPVTILSIKYAFVSHPSRYHICAMLLLAHFLLLTLDFVIGVIACC